MISVIQCAASKQRGAGRLIDDDGKPVVFVARPGLAPKDELLRYCHPDDIANDGLSWRTKLLEYNKAATNDLNLLQALDLYARDIYRRLVQKMGSDHVFILSAGWGLLESTFLVPDYDITFSPAAELYKRRDQRSRDFHDFNMLPGDTNEDILFFGGKHYIPLFASLTANIHAKRTIFYNSNTPPEIEGCELIRFETKTKTNWHYECAQRFLEMGL